MVAAEGTRAIPIRTRKSELTILGDFRHAIETPPVPRHVADCPGGRGAEARHGRGALRRARDWTIVRLAGAQPRDHELHLRPGPAEHRSAVLVRFRRHRSADRAGAGLAG